MGSSGSKSSQELPIIAVVPQDSILYPNPFFFYINVFTKINTTKYKFNSSPIAIV